MPRRIRTKAVCGEAIARPRTAEPADRYARMPLLGLAFASAGYAAAGMSGACHAGYVTEVRHAAADGEGRPALSRHRRSRERTYLMFMTDCWLTVDRRLLFLVCHIDRDNSPYDGHRPYQYQAETQGDDADKDTEDNHDNAADDRRVQ